MEKLVTLNRASDLTGITVRTLRRRLAAGELPAVIDQRDRRRKLVRTTDLKKILGGMPMRNAA